MSAWYLIFIIWGGAPTSQSSTPFATHEQCVAAGKLIAKEADLGRRYSAICVEGIAK